MNPLRLDSDADMIFHVKLLFPIYFILTTIVLTVQDYTKLLIIRNDRKHVLRAMIDGFKFVVRHFFRTMGLFYLNMIFAAIVLGIFIYARTQISAVSSFTVFLVLLFGQIMLFLRIGFKLLHLTSAHYVLMGAKQHE